MLCKCGCGTETPLAKRTDPRYGTINGQPLEFVIGHRTKTTHCLRGHLRSPDNVYKSGACKECSRAKGNARYTPKRLKGYCLHGHLDMPENRDSKGDCAICYKEKRLTAKGWTVEIYEQTLLEQGNRCAVCRQPSDRGPLCTDHEYSNPPKHRGLLCNQCNTALGLLRDNQELCRAAADYLEFWSSKNFLEPSRTALASLR